jgi:hypothetical protein
MKWMLLGHGRLRIRQNVRGFRTLSGGRRFTNIALVLEKQYMKLSLVKEQANIKSKMRVRCLCSGILAACSQESLATIYGTFLCLVLAYTGEVFHLLVIQCRFVKKNYCFCL